MKKVFLALVLSLVICVCSMTNSTYASVLGSTIQNQPNYIENPTEELIDMNEMEIQTNYQDKVDQNVIKKIIEESKKIHENQNTQQNNIPTNVIDPGDGGMNVGAAWPYTYIGYTKTVNCYGYALGITASLNPGSIAWRNNGIAVATPLDMIVDAVEQDLNVLGGYTRTLNSATNFVTSNEYK